MTPEQEIYMAQRAHEVLTNEAYIQAWDAIRKEVIEQWEQSPARDKDGRESLWIILKQLDKLKITLEATMDAGKLKSADLAHREKTRLQKLNVWLGGQN